MTSVIESHSERACTAAHRAALAIRRSPFSVAVSLLILVLAAVTGILNGPSTALRSVVGTGFHQLAIEGRWWTALTAVFFADGLLPLLLGLACVLLFVGLTERRIGTARTAVAFVVTPFVGTLLGAGVQALIAIGSDRWMHSAQSVLVIDPLSAVGGTLMFGSAYASALVRRRTRVLTVLVVAMLLLYSGDPSDLYRAGSLLAGWLLGLVLRPNQIMGRWARSSFHEIRALMASVVVVVALGPVTALGARHPRGLLAPLAFLLNDGSGSTQSPLWNCSIFDITPQCQAALNVTQRISIGPIALAVLPLLSLLVVAYGLLRGRRFAMWLGVVLLGSLAAAAAIFLDFFPDARDAHARAVGHDWGLILSLVASVLLPAVIAVLLIVLRHNFRVLASRRKVIGYVLTVVGAAVVLAALYVAVGAISQGVDAERPATFFGLVRDALQRFVPVDFMHRVVPAFAAQTPLAELIYHGIGPVFWLVVVVAAIPPMIGSQVRARGSKAVQARELLETAGGDSLSYMATWPGNDYWIDEQGESAIGYRVIGGVAITTGGPFGVESRAKSTIESFARFCDDSGWVPVFYGVRGDLKEAFSGMGWDPVTIAEESLIPLETWSTTGKKMQDVRTAGNKAARAGVQMMWTTYQELPHAISAQIAEISEQWVADKNLPEMAFTLGGLDEMNDPAVRLGLAIGPDQTVLAVTSWLPAYRGGAIVGRTLDVMRRRADSMNGVMEFLIASTAELMREDGLEFISLSAAPLARSQPSQPDPVGMDRTLDFVANALEPVYGFRSLFRFKRKFQPSLRPVLMAYPDPVALPTIGLALVRAYLPTLSLRQAVRLLRSRG